jgi:hypothetical protein
MFTKCSAFSDAYLHLHVLHGALLPAYSACLSVWVSVFKRKTEIKEQRLTGQISNSVLRNGAERNRADSTRSGAFSLHRILAWRWGEIRKAGVRNGGRKDHIRSGLPSLLLHESSFQSRRLTKLTGSSFSMGLYKFSLLVRVLAGILFGEWPVSWILVGNDVSGSFMEGSEWCQLWLPCNCFGNLEAGLWSDLCALVFSIAWYELRVLICSYEFGMFVGGIDFPIL